jgi:hypothetical protein
VARPAERLVVVKRGVASTGEGTRAEAASEAVAEEVVRRVAGSQVAAESAETREEAAVPQACRQGPAVA